MKIGVGVPLSGMGSALGREMAQAIELAVDDANSRAGRDGIVITLSILDDNGSEQAGRVNRSGFAGGSNS
jgi:ABC-type branched-subunit amino acid transport system substrate-binding protein